jgi:hypothetical protein
MDCIGPGDTGPAVERIQRRVGASVTGVYDDETVLAVRGMQVLLRTAARDGCWDAEIEYAVTRRAAIRLA